MSGIIDWRLATRKVRRSSNQRSGIIDWYLERCELSVESFARGWQTQASHLLSSAGCDARDPFGALDTREWATRRV